MPAVDPRILTQLVAHDRRVSQVREALSAGQHKIDELETLEKEYALELAEARERLRGVRLEIRKAELEVAELRRQVSVHTGHLNEINEQREWRALNDEIRYLQRQIEEKEEAALARMEEGETFENAVAEAEKRLNEKHAELTAQRTQMERERERLESRLSDANLARDEFVAQMPPATLRFYERRASRMDLPVVWLFKDACGYCHHRLTPQAQLEVRHGSALVVCDGCGRIVVAPAPEAAGSAPEAT